MDRVGHKREVEESEGEGTQTDTESIELCSSGGKIFMMLI